MFYKGVQQELLGINFANIKSWGKEMIKFIVDTRRQATKDTVLTSRTLRYKGYILTYDDKNLCYNIP